MDYSGASYIQNHIVRVYRVFPVNLDSVSRLSVLAQSIGRSQFGFSGIQVPEMLVHETSDRNATICLF